MSYKVVEEFIVSRDGTAVHHTEAGSMVELSAEEAAELVEAGKVVPVGKPAVPDPAVTEWLAAEDQYLEDVSLWLEAETRVAQQSMDSADYASGRQRAEQDKKARRGMDSGE
ncbi:hypothetical protein [Mycolicibacterium vaccae]|uniref:hypothetical protein n=1 Tax=Mycolicibacterium vaccae TaxID=1810 RepID=UPI003D00192F